MDIDEMIKHVHNKNAHNLESCKNDDTIFDYDQI